MFFKICTIIVSFFACTFAQGGPVTEKYPHHAMLDSQNYTMYWKTNATSILIEVHVTTQGWAGLGFSEDGKMFPGDAVIGSVSADGTGHLTDFHTVEHRAPILDAHQDYQLLDSLRDANGTMLKLSRDLDTGDRYDWTLSIFVIWTFGDLDEKTGIPLYHGEGNRGAAVL